jgi:DNA-binding transcriptional MerR regulator
MTRSPRTTSHHRSGAVARMLGVPVATLRNWERRYALTQPATSPSGQRLYSADDVRRLTLIKQLNDLGHAIGQLAALDMAQLQQVAATHANTLAATQSAGGRAAALAPRPPLRLAVIGPALGERLRRPALLQRLGAALVLLGPFEDAAQAAAALADTPVDAVLVQQPQLHPDWLAAFDAAAPALAATPKAVLYRFAADAVSDALADAGLRLLREPQPDSVLAQWLQDLSAPHAGAAPTLPLLPTPAPRRWSDAALADFASLSSTIACECPRHLAELLVQLSHFEAYSADCEHRNAADAALHGHLVRVTAACRNSLEAALEHVARHEGLLLPR